MLLIDSFYLKAFKSKWKAIYFMFLIENREGYTIVKVSGGENHKKNIQKWNYDDKKVARKFFKSKFNEKTDHIKNERKYFVIKKGGLTKEMKSLLEVSE